jgi:hypothetical protein
MRRVDAHRPRLSSARSWPDSAAGREHVDDRLVPLVTWPGVGACDQRRKPPDHLDTLGKLTAYSFRTPPRSQPHHLPPSCLYDTIT